MMRIANVCMPSGREQRRGLEMEEEGQSPTLHLRLQHVVQQQSVLNHEVGDLSLATNIGAKRERRFPSGSSIRNTPLSRVSQSDEN
jgi:hypothetical protein